VETDIRKILLSIGKIIMGFMEKLLY
jgi:hypothetical protein